jgi:hypothetical protein
MRPRTAVGALEAHLRALGYDFEIVAVGPQTPNLRARPGRLWAALDAQGNVVAACPSYGAMLAAAAAAAKEARRD